MKLKFSNLMMALVSTVSVSSTFAYQSKDVVAKVEKICPAYKFSNNEYSFRPMNPAAKVVAGVSLPAIESTLYRGAMESNPQFDVLKAVRGMYGEKNWVLASPLFWGLTTVLTGKATLDKNFLPAGGLPLEMKTYFKARGILDAVNTALSCHAPGFYSEEEASEIAKDLMNKYFNSVPTTKLETRYFNMKDANYYEDNTQNIGFGNNAIDLIISSSNDQIASIYGKKVIILKDVRKRALDLGFWNFIHTGSFWDHWIDNGEVNAPGYATSEEVVGYQERLLDKDAAGHGQREPGNKVVYGLYKVQYKKQNLIMVISGQDEVCLVQDPTSQKVFLCKDNWSGKISAGIIAGPQSRGVLAPVTGVIMNCGNDKNCKVPEGFFEWYGKTKSESLQKLDLAIDGKTVNGQILRVLPSEKIAEPVENTVKVISATYGASSAAFSNLKGNVTTEAAKFATGKTEVTYKISHRFLGVPEIAQGARFDLEWICTNQPKKVNTVSIPAPADTKSFDMKCDE